MGLATLVWFVGVSGSVAAASGRAEKAGATVGMAFVLAMIFFAWFLPFLAAILVGLLLRRGTIVERGPTGGGGSPEYAARKPFLIAGSAGLLIVLIAGGLRGRGGAAEEFLPDRSAPPAASSDDVAGAAGNREGKSPEAPPVAGPRLGEEFTLGDYKYRIVSADRRQVIGDNPFLRKQASGGAAYVVVSYTIENCSRESATVLSDDFKLLDASGRKFQASSDANMALLSGEDKDFLLSELQPGIPRRMTTAFEVPASSLRPGLMLVVPKKGLFGRGDVRIAISP